MKQGIYRYPKNLKGLASCVGFVGRHRHEPPLAAYVFVYGGAMDVNEAPGFSLFRQVKNDLEVMVNIGTSFPCRQESIEANIYLVKAVRPTRGAVPR